MLTSRLKCCSVDATQSRILLLFPLDNSSSSLLLLFSSSFFLSCVNRISFSAAAAAAPAVGGRKEEEGEDDDEGEERDKRHAIAPRLIISPRQVRAQAMLCRVTATLYLLSYIRGLSIQRGNNPCFCFEEVCRDLPCLTICKRQDVLVHDINDAFF